MTHNRFFNVLLIAIVTMGTGLFASSAHAQAKQGPLTDADVSEAIEAIKKYFYDTQDPATGGWYGSHHQAANAPDHRNNWGPTAMGALSLIVAGESPQNPKLAKALKLLAEVEITGVYAMSMRTHLWSYLPQGTYGKLLAKDSEAMLRSAYGPSRFGYMIAKESAGGAGGRIDNSTTQYGVLALWQASKRGADIPKGFWVDAIENFLDQQSDVDGGWAYSGNRNTSQTMTCAGLAVLFVAQQELFRDQSKPNEKVTTAINKGLGFLDENFGGGKNQGHGGGGYMWYGYERVALASGRKYFGGKDWFQTIAHQIIARKGKYGPKISEAAFDLMFLTRGRVPVWINKLAIPGAAWNNRPNDVYFLNRYISEYREHEVNWQVVDTESPARDWLAAPLMWISSDGPLELNEQQIAKIKTYLDLGGTIIANPEERSGSFRDSIEKLAEAMYPDLKWAEMDREHPMATLLEGDSRGAKRPNTQILSNGARVLMIMPKDDWGMIFQKDEDPDPDKTDAWKNIVNIYGVVTDRGMLTPRLDSPIVPLYQGATKGTVKVVIPQWEDPAGMMPEHNVYRMMQNYMHNESGMKLIVEKLPFAQLAAADPALLHMVGVNAVEVKPGEREAIQAYLNRGGTILVENLGGRGDFADSIREQLGPTFPGDDERVSMRSSIATSRGLPDGAASNRRVVYRRMVLENADPEGKLLLRGYTKGERMPVLLSYEDLSLGMLGVRQYGINGYSIESSRKIMLNVLLEASQAYPGSTVKTAPAQAAAP